MSRIFITGSAGGLGQRAANLLIQSGHRVVLHARDGKRAKDAVEGVPDSLKKAPKTQAWLAAGTDPSAMVSGRYFYHGRPRAHHPAADDVQMQEQFLAACERYSGITFPK